MGLLDKLKNTFFEEEYIEVEEKPKVKKEPVKKEIKRSNSDVGTSVKQRTVESKPKITRYDEIEPEKPVRREIHRDSIEDRSGTRSKNSEDAYREEKSLPKMIEEIDIPKKEATLEEKTFKRETSFGYFDDEDFLDFTEEDAYQEPPKRRIEPVREIATPVIEQPKGYDNPLYGTPQPVSSKKEEKTTFRPTPIISPIYGILDKNYKKEEVIDRKESRPSSYVSRKNADLDSIREKAFGSSLTSDFGLTTGRDPVLEEESSVDSSFDVEDNLLYDMTEEVKAPAVDKVTLQDAEEYFQDLGLEYNIDYKDAKHERATGRRVAKSPKLDDIEEVEEDIEIPNSPVSKRSASENTSSSLEDNLFDLIDSMYEDKE